MWGRSSLAAPRGAAAGRQLVTRLKQKHYGGSAKLQSCWRGALWQIFLCITFMRCTTKNQIKCILDLPII